MNTQQDWGFYFRVYKGPKSLSPMAISLALNRQWQLQLAINSPMTVATCLLAYHLKKATCHLKKPEKASLRNSTWNSPVWLAIPTGTYITSHTGDLFSLQVHIAIARSDSFTETKLASGTGGLGAACMRFTSKRAPSRKYFKNDPIWEKCL